MKYLLVLMSLTLFSFPSLGQSADWWTCKEDERGTCEEINLEKALFTTGHGNDNSILIHLLAGSDRAIVITCSWDNMFKGRLCFNWEEKEKPE